jgi:hypothetical protein
MREKISKMRMGKYGKKHTEESKLKISLNRKGKRCREEHPNWKKDRSTLAKTQNRNDSAYREWRHLVWSRDKFKCKIANKDCCGRIEAHHILIWSEHPDLRYEVNNGITLCHFHHPRKRQEERDLIPTFISLLSTN